MVQFGVCKVFKQRVISSLPSLNQPEHIKHEALKVSFSTF